MVLGTLCSFSMRVLLSCDIEVENGRIKEKFRMKKYKHLVFDIDGTILNTADVNNVSLQRALKELRGETIPLQDLYFSFGIPGLRTMEILEFEDSKAAFDVWNRHYEDCMKELGMNLFPGIQGVLDELAEKDVSLGIITSKLREEYERDFHERGLDRYFGCSITSSDTKRGKPNPDPMLEYIKRTQANPEETIYFGDSVYDMECAKNAGVDGALVLWGCLQPEGIEAAYRLKTPEKILQFV